MKATLGCTAGIARTDLATVDHYSPENPRQEAGSDTMMPAVPELKPLRRKESCR
jgi:hypothetical protein